MPGRALQTQTINLRASADQKALIDRAAKRLGKSRTEFVLDTMREASENVLLDQRLGTSDRRGVNWTSSESIAADPFVSAHRTCKPKRFR